MQTELFRQKCYYYYLVELEKLSYTGELTRKEKIYLADTRAKNRTISQAGIGSCNAFFSALWFDRQIPPLSHGCDVVNGGSPRVLRPYHVPKPRIYWSIGSVMALSNAANRNKYESRAKKARMNKVRSCVDASDKVTAKKTEASGKRFN